MPRFLKFLFRGLSPRYLCAVVSIAWLSACSVSRPSPAPARHAEKRPAADVAPVGKKAFVAPLAVDRNEVVSFAKSLQGTPYKYGSADPANGLDCSGLVYYVLGHFNIKSPRRSVDFTNEGREVPLENARPGDLILFTGSDNGSGTVGHIGFVTDTIRGKLFFVHSSSGKNVGVVTNELKGYYQTHFVKVISIFR